MRPREHVNKMQQYVISHISFQIYWESHPSVLSCHLLLKSIIKKSHDFYNKQVVKVYIVLVQR